MPHFLAQPQRRTFPIPMIPAIPGSGPRMGASQAISPPGPSGPLRQVYPVLPLVSSPFLSTTRNTRYGRGIIVPVPSLSAGQSLTITHNLGRIIQGYHVMMNDNGAQVPPKLTWTNNTRNTLQITPDSNMATCLVWFF